MQQLGAQQPYDPIMRKWTDSLTNVHTLYVHYERVNVVPLIIFDRFDQNDRLHEWGTSCVSRDCRKQSDQSDGQNTHKIGGNATRRINLELL